MCGITGFCDLSGATDQTTFTGMIDVLQHRGPDDHGYVIVNIEQASIGLGHRRLSILDLSDLGHQPMQYADLVMVYNGEVYNFKDLRKNLEELGYTFNSESDSEVVLKAFHCWGIKAISRFNGMFAIAILDKAVNKIYLIRDRAGVKPLFWYHSDGLLLFASELKSFHKHPKFLKEIDMNSMALFFRHGYIPQPYCIFNNSRKLQAGHYIEFNINTFTAIEKKYWDIIDYYQMPRIKISFEDAIAETEKLLRSACEYRMIADVPVGIFLSGGYDSSAVAAILQNNSSVKLRTITIGFIEKEFNEAHHAKKVASYLDTDHTEYYCSIKDALEIIPMLPEIWDEPIADSSTIATTLVSRLARQRVTVCLSADGGDEIFGGYEKYLTVRKKLALNTRIPHQLIPFLKLALGHPLARKALKAVNCESAAERFQKTAKLLISDPVKLFMLLDNIFTANEIEQLFMKRIFMLPTNFDSSIQADWLSTIQAVDYKTYMADDILTKVDRATMSVGLEGREPLLDYRLAEFLAQLPANYKLSNFSKKIMLKHITHKYLPEEIMNRPKMGFGVPVCRWFNQELGEFFNYYLDPCRIRKARIFNTSVVNHLKRRYLSGDRSCFERLWLILLFEMWRDRWM